MPLRLERSHGEARRERLRCNESDDRMPDHQYSRFGFVGKKALVARWKTSCQIRSDYYANNCSLCLRLAFDWPPGAQGGKFSACLGATSCWLSTCAGVFALLGLPGVIISISGAISCSLSLCCGTTSVPGLKGLPGDASSTANCSLCLLLGARPNLPGVAWALFSGDSSFGASRCERFSASSSSSGAKGWFTERRARSDDVPGREEARAEPWRELERPFVRDSERRWRLEDLRSEVVLRYKGSFRGSWVGLRERPTTVCVSEM